MDNAKDKTSVPPVEKLPFKANPIANPVKIPANKAIVISSIADTFKNDQIDGSITEIIIDVKTTLLKVKTAKILPINLYAIINIGIFTKTYNIENEVLTLKVTPKFGKIYLEITKTKPDNPDVIIFDPSLLTKQVIEKAYKKHDNNKYNITEIIKVSLEFFPKKIYPFKPPNG